MKRSLSFSKTNIQVLGTNTSNSTCRFRLPAPIKITRVTEEIQHA
jgi:hypothetical protein